MVPYREYNEIPFGKQQVPISAARSFPGESLNRDGQNKEQTDPHRNAIGRLAASRPLENLILTGAESGNIVPGAGTPVLAKHSKSFSLVDCISVGVDRMQRNFEPTRKQVETW